MALPVTIPNTFANATSSIPLSQLDTNFSTLANAVNGLNSGSETLANLKATTANVGVLTVTGNATIGDASTDTVTLNSTLTANTAVIFAAGTSAAPSITTTGDTNTGIFFPAADTIAFSEGGVEAMRIDSDGDVGIGATSISRKLQISQSNATTYTGDFDAAPNQLYIVNTNTTTNAYTGLQMDVGSNSQAAISAIRTGDGEVAMAFGTRVAGVRAERMRIDSSGNVGIGTSSPSQKLHVVGTGYITDNLLFDSGSVVGLNTTDGSDNGYLAISGASADGSDRGGFIYLSGNERATDAGSLVLGAGNTTSGTGSPGVIAFRTGSNTERARITSGGYFKASDNGTYNSSTDAYHEFNQSAQNIGQMVRATNGSYNSSVLDIRCSRAASADYYLIVGRSSNGSDNEFYITGAGNAYADGTWNNNGADYAEFFESANGQALTLGATVVLDGNKVREATDQDPASAIIGVVRPKEPSKASMVVGNTAWNKWANKYLTDDFDRYIMEDHDVVEWEEQVLEREAVAAVEAVVDEEGNEVSPAVPAQEAVYKTKQHSYESHNIPAGVTVPADAVRKTHDDKGNKFQHYKLNPAWDKDAEYVNRENRPEWNIIGLLGQVKILKGQPVGDRWIKMRDVSATVEEWMIR